MPIYKEMWIEHYGSIIRQTARIDEWLRVATVTHIPLGLNWVDMDDFWLNALSSATSSYIKEQNDQSNKSIKDMEARLDGLKQQQGPNWNMPNFFQK